jgi:hypothetical protein
MDPLSLIGGVSAVGAITAAIVKTLKSLSDARGKFEHADTTIHLLISELTTVKASLGEIEDWAAYFAQSISRQELVDAFKVSFEGCKIAMNALAEDIADLTSNSPFSSNNPFFIRAKYTWNETGMRDHADRLRSQVAALQLLVQAVKWYAPRLNYLFRRESALTCNKS